MSCSGTSILKPSTMAANTCLISLPYLYIQSSTPKIPFKLKNLSYSCSSSSFSFSLTNKRTNFYPVVSALEEENSTIVLEEQENEEEAADVESIGDDEEGEGYSEPSEDAKLFVGNLSFDVDSEKLAHLFEQAGVVEIAEVIYNRATDQSRGFGFVTMSSVEEAEKAVDMFNRYDLKGRLLTVNKAAARGSRPERAPRVFEPSFRIYVGNLPWDVDNSRLEQIFSEHGKVVDARATVALLGTAFPILFSRKDLYRIRMKEK